MNRQVVRLYKAILGSISGPFARKVLQLTSCPDPRFLQSSGRNPSFLLPLRRSCDDDGSQAVQHRHHSNEEAVGGRIAPWP